MIDYELIREQKIEAETASVGDVEHNEIAEVEVHRKDEDCCSDGTQFFRLDNEFEEVQIAIDQMYEEMKELFNEFEKT